MKTLTALSISLAFFMAPVAALADGVFSCTGQNSSLHFVFYGDGNQGGHMYINGLQVAVLDTYRVNDISVRATVVGNTAPTEFVLNSDRQKVYVELTGTSEVVCDASVRID